MTIDFTQPVETTATPPRPVMVLFDKDGKPVACEIDGVLFRCVHIPEYGFRAERGMVSYVLRNVASKPVLHEVWVAMRGTGGLNAYGTKREAVAYQDMCQFGTVVEIRHIVWNSDGSPVDQGPCRRADCNGEE